MRHPKGIKGFTIVELLIVVVVISILAAITIVAFNGVQQRARDAQRVSDLRNIKGAMLRWSIDNGQPVGAMNAGSNGTVTGWFDGVYSPYQSVLQALSGPGYLPAVFHDPTNTKSSPYYAYMVSDCTAGDQTVRIVFAHLEVAPSQTVAQQVGNLGCNSSSFTQYSTTYNMNYAVPVVTK